MTALAISRASSMLLVVSSVPWAQSPGAALEEYPPLLPEVWTLDDDGPADFSDLGAAIAAAARGDILLIEPGNYGSATISKPLRLYGNHAFDRPSLGDLLVSESQSVDLAHLRIRELDLVEISGRARIDDCEVVRRTRVSGCSELVATRSSFEGWDDDYYGWNALEIEGESNVQLVDSIVQGGKGYSGDDGGGDGGHGIDCSGGSQVLIAGCTISGGNGDGFYIVFDGPYPGYGGDGLVVWDSAYVDVRGSASDLVRAGFLDGDTGDDGSAIRAFDGGSVVHSGVTVQGDIKGSTTSIVPPSPYVEIRGDDGPGAERRILAFGPPGAVMLVVASSQSAPPASHPLLDVPLWLDLAQAFNIIAMPLIGQSEPAEYAWTLPLEFTPGIAYHFQGAVAGGPSGPIGTNAANILIGY